MIDPSGAGDDRTGGDMRTLVLAQNKGGVGKTSISRLLSEYFARRGYRVLGLDFDPQCNYSRRFVPMEYDPADPDGVYPAPHPASAQRPDDEWDGRSSTADIFSRHTIVPYPSWVENLDVLPGEGQRLRELEAQSRDGARSMSAALRDFLARDDIKARYDLAIVDTSPSKDALARSAMMVASHLLIPTLLEVQAAEGLVGMLSFWRQVNRARTSPLEIVGILPNKVRKVGLHEGLLEGLRGHPGTGKFVTPVSLADRIAFAESDHVDAKPRSVFDQSKTHKARQEAEAVGNYVHDKLFESGE